MATLKTIPDGTLLKIPINGVVRDCYSVGYNHYGKGEVTILAPGWRIFQGLVGSVDDATANTLLFYPTPYIGSRYDTLVEHIFPDMLPEELRGSMVSVPVSVFTVFSNMYDQDVNSNTGYGRTDYNTIAKNCYSASGGSVRTLLYGGLIAYNGTGSGLSYPIPCLGEVVNRRAFLFSVSEAYGFTSKTFSSGLSSTSWNQTPGAVAYFDPPNSSDRPSGYRTNAFAWLKSHIAETAFQTMEFRGGALVRGWYKPATLSSQVQAELGIIAEMWNKPVSNQWGLGYQLAFLSDQTIYGMREFGPYPSWFGFCLDGNCEVANGSGGVVITKGTAVKSYRKLDGVWYRAI